MIQLDLEQCVFTACVWAATARKAGDVHRYRDFADLTYLDYVQSAHAIAPIIADMVDAPIGETVLECVKATRRVVTANTNLGIILLLVPLSKPERIDYMLVWDVMKRTTVRDAELIGDACRLYSPGNTGNAIEKTIREFPTETLLQVMKWAAEHDTIAQYYDENFRYLLWDWQIVGWLYEPEQFEQRICEMQIEILANYPDSVFRQSAGDETLEVSRRAREVEKHGKLNTASGVAAYREFDAYLCQKSSGYNTSITADLVTALLFVWLRYNKLDLNRPFAWSEYAI